LTSGNVSATGNVFGANFIGNISGNVSAPGANTQIEFNDNGITNAVSGFTFNKSSNLVTVGGNVNALNFNGNVFGTSVSASGTVTAASTVGGVITGSSTSVTGTQTAASTVGGVITGSSVSVTGGVDAASVAGGVITGTSTSVTGTQTAASTVGGVITGSSTSVTGAQTAASTVGGVITGSSVSVTGNVNATSFNGNVFGTTVSATGNITGANLILTTGTIDGPAAGRITINGSDIDTDFAVDGDTLANVFYVDAGTGTASFGASTQVTNAIVNFATSTSIKVPVGNTGQRPAVGVTGMTRFNTTSNALEVYDNSQWVTVGVPSFTVIADQQFAGDGVTVAFTLSSTQTTNSCIVSINGVVQIPVLAYSVAGTNPTCVLTFTEAPAAGDVIDVRQITTTTTVTSISNSSGNAVISVSDTSATIVMTGDLEVTGNVSVLGGIATDQILNGTSDVNIPIPDGTVHIDVGGIGNIAEFFTTGVVVKGNVTPFANVTYNLGNTTNRWNDLYLANSTIYLGNAQISANATSLIFTNPQGGQTVLAGATASITGAIVSASGNITGGNIRTAGLISATGSITGASVVGGVMTGSSVSVTGAVTGASVVGGVMTGSSVSVTGAVTGASVVGTSVSSTGNVTGGNILTAGSISATGNLTANSLFSNGQVSSVGNVFAPNVDVSTGTIFCGNIVNQNANAVGNIGSSAKYFNTIFAKATSAQYADLAEKYTADATYAPGTVVSFGGSQEVTMTTVASDTRIAGVVSTNPSYRMNDGLVSEHTAMVALTGRVPTSVTGTVRKGDMMVSAGNGVARAEANPQVGTVIGKALADSDGDAVIEVVVGRV